MANIKKITRQLLGVKAKLLKKASDAINAASFDMAIVAESLSPIDTGEYNKNHKINNAKIKSDTVTGGIINDADDAYGVEFGFRSTPVNRHRKQAPNQPYSQRPVIYNGVGANVYQRTQKAILPKLKNIFIRIFGKG